MLPVATFEGVLGSFSRSGTDFALGTADGRVKTYDTVSGRLRTTCSDQGELNGGHHLGDLVNGHLVEGQQCLVWLDEANTANGRSSNPASSSRAWLAVGNSQGTVKAFDSATGDLKWQTPNCSEGGVTCLAHSSTSSSSSGTLVCSGQDGHVSCLDTSSGAVLARFKASKDAIKGAAITADGSKLLVGSSSMALWDLATKARMAKCKGHAGSLRAVAFAPDGNFAISAGTGENAVVVWATSGSKKVKKLGGVAVAQMPVPAPVVQLHTADAAGEGFYAAGVTEAGEALVWLCRPEGEAKLAVQQVARVNISSSTAAAVGSSSGSKEVILCVFLEPAAAGTTLLVARGSYVKPVFTRLQVSAEGNSSTTITLEPALDGALFKGQQAVAGAPAAKENAKPGSKAAAAVLGADNAGDLVKQRAAAAMAVDGPAAGRKRSEPEPDSAPPAAAAVGADSDDEAFEGQDEATLGQRVAALEERQQQAGAPGPSGRTGAAADEGDDAMAGGGEAAAAGAAALLGSGPIKADSMGVLLQQALRSGDKALLERCLAVSNDRVINNSVRRLVPADAALLLREAVARLQSKPARGQQLAGWVRGVLVHHTAYLMAAPGVQPVMTSLYQVIESRLAMQRTLLSLAGRLDLLLAQAPPTGAAGAAAQPEDQPQVVYDESNSEEEVEVEDVFAGGADDLSDEYEEVEDSEMMEEDDEGSEEDDDDM